MSGLTTYYGDPFKDDVAFQSRFEESPIIDDSPVGGSTTLNGGIGISGAQAFEGDNSLLFDNTDDYIVFHSDAALNFGTGDFCIEWYGYNQLSSDCLFCNTGSTIYLLNDVFTNPGADIALNFSQGAVWKHFAITRSGSTLRSFVDGTLEASVTNSTSFDFRGMNFGRFVQNDNLHVNGHIDDMRLTKGHARYTANFTPPVTPNISTLQPQNIVKPKMPLKVNGNNFIHRIGI